MAVVSLLAGAPTDTSATVASETGAASTSCRCAYSTSPTLASPTYTAAATSDSAGYVKFTLTGLAPGTTYYYAIEVGGTLDPTIAKFKTHPAAAGVATSFTIAHASCGMGSGGSGTSWVPSTHLVHQAIAARDPLMFLHLGDIHYRHASTAAVYQSALRQAITATNAVRLYQSCAIDYVWDDHDFGGDNSDSTWSGRADAASVYRQAVPHYPLNESGAIYHAFTIGRVRFVVTDLRYYRSVDTATDDSTKTMLGATQKAWLKDQLVAAKGGPLTVWLNTQVWNDDSTSGIDADGDHWGAFSTERAEISEYLASNGITNVIQLTGDMHALGIDQSCDYSSGHTAPMRIYAGSSLDSTPIVRGANWDQSHSGRGQYGLLTVADDGNVVDVLWQGFQVDPATGAETLIMSDSFSVGTAPVAGTHPVKVWDGTAWVSRPLKVNNGAAWTRRPVKTP